MVTSLTFFLSWFAVLAITGAVLYVVDRNVGVKIYRWFYDMTHEHPLNPEQSRGFLYQRKSQSRFAIAVLISLVQSGLAVFYGASTIPSEVLSIVIEVPCLMFGFYLGPIIYNFWSKREQMFETVDQLESGEISIAAEVREMSEKAVSKIKETIAPDAEPAPSAALEAAPEKKSEPAPDPKALMDKYLNPR